jgi:hypothetical protein
MLAVEDRGMRVLRLVEGLSGGDGGARRTERENLKRL